MAKSESIDGFRGQRRNANKHTSRGIGMLQRAMETSGYVAPMTAAADGEIIDGSARLDVAADVFDGVDPLVVDHDGTRPVIMRRTDIPNADDPRAVRISLEANRIAAADLEWDAAILGELAADDPAMLAGLWTDAELAEVLLRGLIDADDSTARDVDEGHYSRKLQSPVYKPSGENPSIASLFDSGKVAELEKEIDAAALPDDVRAFLRFAAQRHRVFNYRRIADFYAHADSQVQGLMERSALVIIDFDKAIEYGFVQLSDKLTELVGADHGRA